MARDKQIASPLQGKRVALAESRELDLLADLYTRRGATVIRMPLITIEDSPDRDGITAWLQDFVARPPDILILMTGEGVRRLLAAAERAACREQFIEALSGVCKISRGPKPVRALKVIGLEADIRAPEPTTDGVIQALEEMELAGKSMAVQLYGEDPNERLMDFLRTRELDRLTTVAPYVYRDDLDAEQVLALIDRIASDEVDLMVFTSKPQVRRLLQVAGKAEQEGRLFEGLERITVAAVGPLVADQLRAIGVRVDIMPASSYFMKPLVRASELHFSPA